ncbi:MAG: membrane protein insertase YidC [Treponema sp.]|nr:membrane protein insertase YidC [Treponema sp.]
MILEFSFNFAQLLFREAGLSIISISIIISLLCLPLYAVAEKWQQHERDTVNKLRQKIDKIKKAFKGDEQYMILSTFYRQNHYHPLYALRGSFGLLIQVPFFIAAYSFISNLKLLNGVSFLFINDLGSPDALFSIGGISFNILPLIMTLVNIISSLIYTKGLPLKDKLQLYGMASFFLILLYNSPSALIIYWTMNNLFSLFKNIYYKIHINNKHIFLVFLFSFFCILISFFCYLYYFHVSMVREIIIILMVMSVLPWLFHLFKKQIFNYINIIYEKRLSFIIFITSIFLIWSIFGLFLPTQLLASSPQEFSFIGNYTNPLYFIFISSIQALGLFFIWPLCIYLFFSDNVKKYLSFLFFTISICFIINVFVFSGNYSVISISFIYDNYPVYTYPNKIFNISIMFLLFFITFVLYKTKMKKYISIILSLFIVSILSISFFNIFNINKEFNHLKSYYIKEEHIIEDILPIFSLSQNGKNVVIIMLDRAFSGFLPYIFNESPELYDHYSGFTYYPNTVSFNGYTGMGVPPVFGGYDYIPQEINKRDNISLIEKHNESLLMLPKIFLNNDFILTVTDPPYANYNWIPDLSIFNIIPEARVYNTDSKYTDIWLSENNLDLPLSSEIIKRNLLWYSLHKGLPLFFRSPLYMNGTWCSPTSDVRLRLTLNGYSVLYYLPALTEIKTDNNNYALIMTNNTTHEASFLQAPDYIPYVNVTNYGTSPFSKQYHYHVNAGALKRLADWFVFLKDNNLYDNTRIIIVSDHGPEQNFITDINLPFNVDQFNPLLLYKDFNASGELKTDMSFMTNADVPYLALFDLTDNPVNPFTGNLITNYRKNEPLYIAISGSFYLTKNSNQFDLNPEIDYYVKDNIFIRENWKRVSE